MSHPLKDLTAQAHQMPRNSCLAYRNKNPKTNDSPFYLGVLKLETGETFWVGLWPRTVNGGAVVEVRLSPKK
jgi:hypothetical protein